ncbi:hypothetical protein BDZ89DRAFT_279667 [Hymenopellis radicata]|nr:hypothetical protein BDZ89DRAFT_279667 [Hymenopellis radicata]
MIVAVQLVAFPFSSISSGSLTPDVYSSVDKCLGMCGLESYADATVGSLGIEHRKRLTIAVELAAKPKMLLFLDEPTSGLDSQSSWAIMSFLRSLADAGQAILCTIHQPSAELFAITPLPQTVHYHSSFRPALSQKIPPQAAPAFHHPPHTSDLCCLCSEGLCVPPSAARVARDGVLGPELLV